MIEAENERAAFNVWLDWVKKQPNPDYVPIGPNNRRIMLEVLERRMKAMG